MAEKGGSEGRGRTKEDGRDEQDKENTAERKRKKIIKREIKELRRK